MKNLKKDYYSFWFYFYQYKDYCKFDAYRHEKYGKIKPLNHKDALKKESQLKNKIKHMENELSEPYKSCYLCKN